MSDDRMRNQDETDDPAEQGSRGHRDDPDQPENVRRDAPMRGGPMPDHVDEPEPAARSDR